MSILTQMHILSITLGWVIVAGYVWNALNYFVKLPNRKIAKIGLEDSPTRSGYDVFIGAVMKSHYYVPLFLITIIIIHLIMTMIHVGFFITGFVVFILMLLQISIGIYGLYAKDKMIGPWFYVHRTVAVLLGISIIVHVIAVIRLNS